MPKSMPKSTKSDSKTVTVDVEEFSKTRDSVLASIAQLQSAAYELSRAYINHANQVLGKEHAISDIAAISNTLAAGIKDKGAAGTSSSNDAETGEKKKRKRARADPNAPKRTLTPFFLYMHHNRDHIREELGGDAKPKDVAAEGTKRWTDMPDSQKEVWKKLYADNLATYKEKVAAYKAGLPFDKDDNDRAANQLHLDVAAAEGSNEEEEEEEEGEGEGQGEEQEEEEEEEEEESEPEPAKEPTPPPKRRRSLNKPSKETSTPVTEKKGRNESPEKKRRGGSAKKDTEKTPAGTDSKRSRKKRKSEAGGDDE